MGKIKSSLAAIGQNWSMTQKVYKFLWAEVLGIVLATIIVLAVPVSIFINWLTAVLIAIPSSGRGHRIHAREVGRHTGGRRQPQPGHGLPSDRQTRGDLGFRRCADPGWSHAHQ